MPPKQRYSSLVSAEGRICEVEDVDAERQIVEPEQEATQPKDKINAIKKKPSEKVSPKGTTMRKLLYSGYDAKNRQNKDRYEK